MLNLKKMQGKQNFTSLSFWLTTFIILIVTTVRQNKCTEDGFGNSREIDEFDLVLSSLPKHGQLLHDGTVYLDQSSLLNKRSIRAIKGEESGEKLENSSVENITTSQNAKTTGSNNLIDEYCSNVKLQTYNDSEIQFTNKMLRCLLLEIQDFKNAKIKADRIKTKGEIYLPDDYSKLEVPLINITYLAPNGSEVRLEQAVESQVYLNIRKVRRVDEVNQEVTLDMDVVLIWVDGKILSKVMNLRADDPNLLSGAIFLNPIFLNKIWTPDLYFEEMVSISSPTVMGKAETVILFPNLGAITYRTRIIVKLTCEMNFYYYPADTQECTFTFKSFSYTTKMLTVEWVKSAAGVHLLETSDPNFDYQLNSYTLEHLPIDLGPHTSADSTYSTLKFTIKSRRKLSFHLVQTYIPSAFFVLVTWLCFMIPSDMFEARVGISMTTLLTLTAMFGSVRESAPTVSYVKAIDIWMVACILFLFAALTAFTVSEWVKRVLKRLNGVEILDDDPGGDSPRRTEKEKSENGSARRLRKYESANNYIEKYLVRLLSTGFVTFVIVYWSWLLVESGYWNWEVNSTLNKVN